MRDETYFRYRGYIPIPLYAAVAALFDFGKPSAWEVVFALSCIFCGLLLRSAARLQIGRSSDTRRLHARRLVTSGPYARIRNPIYLGNISIAVGAAVLAGADEYAPILAGLLTLHYLRVIRAEERMLSQRFGRAYDDYCNSVPRLLPRIRLLPSGAQIRHLRLEARIVLFVALIVSVILGVRTIPASHIPHVLEARPSQISVHPLEEVGFLKERTSHARQEP